MQTNEPRRSQKKNSLCELPAGTNVFFHKKNDKEVGETNPADCNFRRDRSGPNTTGKVHLSFDLFESVRPLDTIRRPPWRSSQTPARLNIRRCTGRLWSIPVLNECQPQHIGVKDEVLDKCPHCHTLCVVTKGSARRNLAEQHVPVSQK